MLERDYERTKPLIITREVPEPPAGPVGTPLTPGFPPLTFFFTPPTGAGAGFAADRVGRARRPLDPRVESRR